MDIPLSLRQALENGSCVLFVGAGIGNYTVNQNNCAITSGRDLAKMLADYFSVPVKDENYDLAKISQFVELKKGRKELVAFIKDCLSDNYPNEQINWIPSINWKAIFTTNYDNVLQKAYDNHSNPNQQHVTISRSTGFKGVNPQLEVPIIHLHGTLFEEEQADVVITQRDYIKFRENRRMMFEYLKHQMAMSCVLYVGYSNNDPNWRMLVEEIEEEFYPDGMPNSYRVDPFTEEIDIELLKERNIYTIPFKYDEFVKEAQTQIITTPLDASGLSNLEDRIPSDFIDYFKVSPTAVTRLLSSWEYINQVEWQVNKPDVHSYVRGDKPSWSVVFNDLYFSRDIEEEIYDSLLDYATDSKVGAKVCILRGSAGYGVSTLLMILASRLVKDLAGNVFFYRNYGDLREGDIDYAISLSSQRCFFFIDNAADYTSFVRRTLKHARESKKELIFVLGDRTNEWNQARPFVSGDTFEIQPLSDSEIESLIDFLTRTNELNRLEHLSREHQISAIRRNYNRELFVAIREATEDNNIDAIIEDEFFGVKDEFSKMVYRYICCFHQHGSLLRVELLASLMNIDLLRFYEKIKDSLEGVVRYECIDENKQIYAVRARHSLIAAIVWDRCIEAGLKDKMIHDGLHNLNIMYRIDKEAFENFIKSDRFIDSLKNLESKIHFFENACKKDPDNPYVLQHYARMYIRSGVEKPALRMIEEAININGSIRSLYHTKGSILSKIALMCESEEIGKRILIQSEEAYDAGLKMYQQDAYCYQGLAELYLGWAKRVTNEAEKTHYINKSEEIINKGLKYARNKEALWIESSKIDAFIGDHPAQIQSLEKAVEHTPGSVISRYLLARAYNMSNQVDKSIPILATLSKEHPDEYRPSIEYALTIIKNGGTLEQAIAVMNQSTLYGYSDARFLATFGGLLFLNKEFTKSDQVFIESRKREFPNARTILFDPTRHANLNVGFTAKIKYVGESHSYLEIKGFPDLYCRSSKYRGLIFKRGMDLEVDLVFTPLEPLALISEKNKELVALK